MFRFKQRCKLVHLIFLNVLHIQPVICSDSALTPIYCKSTLKQSHKTSNIFHLPGWWRHYQFICSLSFFLSLPFPDSSFNSHSSSYHRGTGWVQMNVEHWEDVSLPWRPIPSQTSSLLSLQRPRPCCVSVMENGPSSDFDGWLQPYGECIITFFLSIFNSHLTLLVPLTGVVCIYLEISFLTVEGFLIGDESLSFSQVKLQWYDQNFTRTAKFRAENFWALPSDSNSGQWRHRDSVRVFTAGSERCLPE